MAGYLHKVYPISSLQCRRQSYKGKLMLRSLWSFIQQAMFDLEIEAVGEAGSQKAKIFTPPPPPPPYSLFLTINCPLETNFSPQYSTAIKLKDCHHNFPLRKYWVISCQNSTCSAGYPNPQFYIISGPPAFSIRGLIWLNECPPTLSF